MTTAVFSMQAGKPCGVTVQGHSGYAEEGYDIVCSAVSSAVIFTANVLSKNPGVKTKCQDAFVSVFCGQPEPLLQDLLSHLQSIATQYPQYLRICYLDLNGGN